MDSYSYDRKLAHLWKKPKVQEAINQCMKVIEQSGLSSDEATKFPEYLDIAIQRSNQICLETNRFSPALFIAKPDEHGGIDVLPLNE